MAGATPSPRRQRLALRLVLRPGAARDITAAHAWYRARSPEVAAGFLDALDARLAELGRRPAAFPVVHRDVRRCLLGRFPYALYFRLLPDEVRIVACTHLRRHHRRWQRRR
ncbi:MAG TPA: type II toxin-antitoxin system RelE/ParE family toxin [Gemmatimonadales bacterium]|nr:type II toxin-antitoxin system RelE/ParE family toxin [Gemmatimonadales bacterium]